MTFPRKVVFGGLLLVAMTAFIEQRIMSRQREKLAARSAEVTRLESAMRRERHRIAQLQADHAAIEREIAAARAAAAEAEARSAMKLWANRIALLRRLLEDMPAQSLPELRLLTPTDWVHVVRTRELDSAERIQTAFGALRAVARQKMTQKLQEALKRFTDASGGELPERIEQLAAHLAAPADLEMLQRYALVRAGRVGDSDETLIRETASSDLISSIGLRSWSMGNNQEWKPPGRENAMNAAARSSEAIAVAFEQADRDGSMRRERIYLEIFQEMFTRLAPQMEDAGFADNIGDELKSAAKRFSSARNGARPENMAELAPFMTNGAKAIEIARPVLAELEYMRDHLGQRATDPAQLRRYLEKPVEQLTVLRNLKLAYDGDSMTMNFSFNEKNP